MDNVQGLLTLGRDRVGGGGMRWKQKEPAVRDTKKTKSRTKIGQLLSPGLRVRGLRRKTLVIYARRWEESQKARTSLVAREKK